MAQPYHAERLVSHLCFLHRSFTITGAVKPQRIQDPMLLAFVRSLKCLACRMTPSEAHHVTTRGAGGDDVAENLMPLCAIHHALWHQKGPGFMCETHPAVRYWLEAAGRQDVLARILC